GKELDREVREFWSCVGQDRVPLPPCEAVGEPEEYPNRGENFNFNHPPGYYAPTGVAARALAAVIPGVEFFVIARLLSGVWLVAGMVVLHLALVRLGSSRRTAVLAPMLLPTIPV